MTIKERVDPICDNLLAFQIYVPFPFLSLNMTSKHIALRRRRKIRSFS